MENESTEWNENKASSNIKKHEGLSFEEAAEVFPLSNGRYLVVEA